MSVYVMLANSLFDKHKHPLETQTSSNNEHLNVDRAWSFGFEPQYRVCGGLDLRQLSPCFLICTKNNTEDHQTSIFQESGFENNV